jgi:putative transposase
MMARLARIVIPEVGHHVTQRGNRRLPVFFCDEDRLFYLDLVAAACATHGVTCLAWCLMDNHVHLILVPPQARALASALGEAHRRYTRQVNFREGWRGYLFQGRCASYPMDEAHLMVAVRYVENNPVAAGMVDRAEDWRGSSARSHIAGMRVPGDGLTDMSALGRHVGNWHTMLSAGLEAADDRPSHEAIESRLRTGRPLAEAGWIAAMEKRLDRRLTPAKPGPKPRES